MITCKNGDEVKRGKVVLVNFPHIDSRNREIVQYKKRPALVVQSDQLNDDKHETIVVVITTNLTRPGNTRVVVNKNSRCGKNMNLFYDSAIVLDNLAIVKGRELDKTIGKCTKMNEVDEALKQTFAL